MNQRKTPAFAVRGSNENANEIRTDNIIPVPTPRATALKSCISCGAPFGHKQSENWKTLCPTCYSYYRAYAHNNAAMRLLREAEGC